MVSTVGIPYRFLLNQSKKLTAAKITCILPMFLSPSRVALIKLFAVMLTVDAANQLLTA